MGVTAKNAIPYPELTDPADVPADMKEMADKLDTFGYVPAGAMFMWPGTVAPAGFLLCVGQTDVPAVDNPILAGLFGTTGGFVRMPDLRDMFVRGATAARPPVVTTGGEEYHKLSGPESGIAAHAHSHTIGVNAAPVVSGSYPWFPVGDTAFIGRSGGSGSGGLVYSNNLVSYANGNHSHSVSGGIATIAAQDAATPHNNVPPFMSLNYIIRAG